MAEQHSNHASSSAQVQPFGIIGRMDAFDSKIENWEAYYERFEQYVAINQIPDKSKVACLLSVMGANAYGLLRNLIAPQKPSEKTLQEIFNVLQNHLDPKPLLIAERFRFHTRNQIEGESISQYIAELKRMAGKCQFEGYLDDALRDRFVCGLISNTIRKKLLTEAELTFTKATTIAISMETAVKDSEELFKSRENNPNGLHKLQLHDRNKTLEKMYIPKNNEGEKKPCYRCGSQRHNPNYCKFKDETCHKCGKRGHIKRQCLAGKGGEKKGVHAIDTGASDEETEETPEEFGRVGIGRLGLHNVKVKDEALLVKVKVEGKPLTMELDTGSAVSVISKDVYEDKFKELPLRKTNIKLETYTKEAVYPLGVLTVQISYKDQRKKLDLYVVHRGGPPLFGRSWLKEINLDWPKIKALNSPGTKVCLNQVLNKHQAVFSEGLGTLKGIKAHLNVKDGATPRFHKPRPVPFARKPKVEAALDRLESAGIVKKVNYSEWASPIVTPVKKNGDLRVCGDFKVTINPVLEVDQYPLPRIEEIFANLSGGTKFSKIDLTSAYLQMEVDEECKKYLTVNTHKGLYQYQRLAYGVASAPALWQKAMDQVTQGLPKTQCYMDDLIVTGRSDEEHLDNLDQVLTRLEGYGLKANQSKCSFLQDKVEYCGHVIDANGLHKSTEKVEAVLQAPEPKEQSQLRSFIGLINYYQRFLPNLSSVLHPLNQLLHNDKKWVWGKAQKDAFLKAKELIASDMVLAHYDPEKPIHLACDASAYGIGAVISHIMHDGSERPIAFASRTLSAAEKGYSQIEKEGLALVWGVNKFNQYLEGRHFTLVTDHQPLTHIFHPHKSIPITAAARIQRWALFLSAYNYTVVYKSTKQHSNADGLSRLPMSSTKEEGRDTVEMFHMIHMSTLPVTVKEIRRESQRNPLLAQVIESTKKGWADAQKNVVELKPFWDRKDELSIHEGCLMWGTRVVIPPTLRKKVLEQLHEGHLGIVKMKGLAREYVWWPAVDRDIEDIARGCEGCQEVQNAPQAAPLHCWEYPTRPWQRLHIDFAGPFCEKMFLVVIDAHTKWPEVEIMKSTTAKSTVEVLRTMFARFGIPEVVVSDNGPQFVSGEFKEFLEINGIRHITSAPYHPSTNGLAERFVQSFKKGIKANKDDLPTQQKLDNFLLSYRIAPQATTGQSPATLMLGRNLRSRLDILKPDLLQTVKNKQLDMMLRRKTSVRNYIEGENVLARNYGRGPKWVRGVIAKQTGPVSYKVKVGELLWRRHADQLRNTGLVANGGGCNSADPIVATSPLVVEPTTSSDSGQLDSAVESGVLLSEASTIDESREQRPADTSNQPGAAATESPGTQERRYPSRDNRRPPDRYGFTP